jgi:RsiW-degrading membrane proteinase PrsW (M82 family)
VQADPASIEYWRTILAGEALPTARGYASLRPVWAVLLSVVAIASGAAFARVAALRGGERRLVFPVRALLGGAAAFGLSPLAFDVTTLLGLGTWWHHLAPGEAGALNAAVGIGLVEEGAKLAGVLLAVERGVRTRAAVATGFGVAAGFATLEAIVSLAGDASASAFARAALGPVAHGLLLVPAALAVAPALRSRRPALALALPLGASAALHAASDLSLVVWPGDAAFYTAGYAAALLTPALLLFAYGRAARLQASRPAAPAALPAGESVG